MKKTANAHREPDRSMKRILLPIIALGGGLAAAPASALELGELTVHSNLGQPLRASIAYALAPNEVLSNSCVSIGSARSGLPGIGGNTISITEHAIIIAGEASIREPMLGMRVTVNCSYTPNLSRDYMLFVDPASMTRADEAVTQVTQTLNVPKAASVSARSKPAQIRNDLMEPIEQASRYQAKVGDTLSGIASRIENRSTELWPAVNAIFQANPNAFVGNDPNKLKAGSWLIIPGPDSSVPIVAGTALAPVAQSASAPVADTSAQESVAAASEATGTADEIASAAYEPPSAAEVPVTVAASEPLVEAAALTDSTNDLHPGGTLHDSNEPTVAPAGNIIAPGAELAGPQATSTPSNVLTEVTTTGSNSESTSLIAWLIGGSFAIIAGLFLFGRLARNRFSSKPVGPVINPPAEPFPDDTDNIDTANGLDYDISDDAPTEENLALDADLAIGTGLGDATGMDVAEDFGFAETSGLDIELPFEPKAEVGNETDIIPPLQQAMESILESEMLPEDDDYDMSVVMDATKMPHPEEVTERDLMAVPVGTDDETLITNSYTISKEVDYDILEQDYEDEMAATQALNEEIARAAAELAKDRNQAMNDDDAVEMEVEGGTVNTRRA